MLYPVDALEDLVPSVWMVFLHHGGHGRGGCVGGEGEYVGGTDNTKISPKRIGHQANLEHAEATPLSGTQVGPPGTFWKPPGSGASDPLRPAAPNLLLLERSKNSPGM